MNILPKLILSLSIFQSGILSANVVSFPQPSNKAATAVTNAVIANLTKRGFAANDPRVAGTVNNVLRFAGGLAGVSTMGFLGGVATGIGLGTGAALLLGGGIYLTCKISGACEINIPSTPPAMPLKSPQDLLIPGAHPVTGAPTAFENPESIIECTETSTFKSCNYFTDCTSNPDSITCFTQVFNYTDKASNQSTTSSHSFTKHFVAIPRHQNADPIFEGNGVGGARPAPINPYMNQPTSISSPAGNNPGSYLTPAQLGENASPEILARLADALYGAASQQSTYATPFIPRNPYDPITQSQLPQQSPITVGDILSPPLIGNNQGAAVNPGGIIYEGLQVGDYASPTGESEASNPTAPQPGNQLDLGPDPGIPYGPQVVGEPSLLVAPFMDLVSPIFTSDFSRSGGTCPSFGFSIALGDFEFEQLCIFLENYRSLFYALTLFVFIFSSIRIILSA